VCWNAGVLWSPAPAGAGNCDTRADAGTTAYVRCLVRSAARVPVQRGPTMKPKHRQAESLYEMHQAWSPSRRSMSRRVYSSTSNPSGTLILRSGSPSWHVQKQSSSLQLNLLPCSYCSYNPRAARTAALNRGQHGAAGHLDDYEVVALEEGAPLLQKMQVPDGRNYNVQGVLQAGRDAWQVRHRSQDQGDAVQRCWAPVHTEQNAGTSSEARRFAKGCCPDRKGLLINERYIYIYIYLEPSYIYQSTAHAGSTQAADDICHMTGSHIGLWVRQQPGAGQGALDASPIRQRAKLSTQNSCFSFTHFTLPHSLRSSCRSHIQSSALPRTDTCQTPGRAEAACSPTAGPPSTQRMHMQSPGPRPSCACVAPRSRAGRHAAMQETQDGVLHPAAAEELGARERAGRAGLPRRGRLRRGRRAQVAVLARYLHVAMSRRVRCIHGNSALAHG